MKGYTIFSLKSHKGHTVKTGHCKLDNMFGVFVNDKLVFSCNNEALAAEKAFDYLIWLIENII
jgi:hypothetical protein